MNDEEFHCRHLDPCGFVLACGGANFERGAIAQKPHSESADHAALEVLARWGITVRWRVREYWMDVSAGAGESLGTAFRGDAKDGLRDAGAPG